MVRRDAVRRATSREWARVDSIWLWLGSVGTAQTQDFSTEVNLNVNIKIVDLWFLYNFYKGRIGFFLNQFCINYKQTLLFSGHRWIVLVGVDQDFSQICTPNLKCHSTGKLCPSTNCTTFILGEFEVFRWNLENLAKVLGWHRRVKCLSGVLTRVWPILIKCWPRWVIRGCWWCFWGDDLGWPTFYQGQDVCPNH
jgi:hypothetical protein